jgi:hypothetical protein
MLPTDIPSVITVEFYKRKYFVGNLVAGILFWRAYSSVTPSVLVFFSDRNGDGIIITDAHDAD